MVAAAGPVTPEGAEILRQAAVDTSAAPAVRASALTALASAQGPELVEKIIDAFASVAVGPGLDPALESAWRQYVSLPAHAANAATFQGLATSTDRPRQALGYGVLLRLAADPPAAGRGGRGGGGGGGGRGGRGQVPAAVVESARTEARAAISAAWSAASVVALLRAVGATQATGYQDRVQEAMKSTDR